MKAVLIKNTDLQRHLKPILHEWLDVINSYVKDVTNDAPYWYNERASLSTFAAAATRANFHILEEYRSPKNYGNIPRTGRADLWFGRRGNWFAAEAKQVWLSLTRGAIESLHRFSAPFSMPEEMPGRFLVGMALGWALFSLFLIWLDHKWITRTP